MIPANLLCAVLIGSAVISLGRLRAANPETPDELAAVSLSLADIWGMTILLTVVLLWVCWRTVRSAWSRVTPQPADQERLVIGVAAIGIIGAIQLPLGLGPTTSVRRSITATIGALFVVLGLISFSRFITGSQTLPLIGSVSEGTVEDGVVIIGIIAAGSMHWFLPDMIPREVPAVILGLAIFLVGVKVLKLRQ